MKRIRLPQHARVQCLERSATLGLTATEISHDAEGDTLYNRLIEGQRECRTLRLNEEIALNIGPAETLVGIEVLDAKQVLGQGQLPSVVLENVPVT